jgi:hypothetical protein
MQDLGSVQVGPLTENIPLSGTGWFASRQTHGQSIFLDRGGQLQRPYPHNRHCSKSPSFSGIIPEFQLLPWEVD